MSPPEANRTTAREDREGTALHAVDTSEGVDPSVTLPRDPVVVSAACSAPAPTRNPGLYVPGFVVTGEIARGGMGVILAAIEVDLGREVAIKMLLPGAAGTEPTTRRFLEEARITARLAHPSIPPIHRIGTLPDGRPFLVMKLIRGRTLGAILTAREQRPSSRSADELDLTALDSPGLLHIFEQICHAVGYAHAQGVIHRDLKPANVMVGNFGEVQVMDWGIGKSVVRRQGTGDRGQDTLVRDETLVLASTQRGAREVSQPSDSETIFGRTMGTPQYMPPEQARGQWEEVDARADVFALGGILCAILTGHPPYTGLSTLAVLRRAETGDLGECFARLDGCGADAELIALAKWCLSPNARNRPPNAAEVARQLAGYRLTVQARLMVAESQRAAVAAKLEEARLQVAMECLAKVAAEERADEAEFYAETLTAMSRGQQRRARGVFLAMIVVLLTLCSIYGNYREQRARAVPPPCVCLPAPTECEATQHLAEHERGNP